MSEDMSLIHLRKLKMKMNKPIYIGQAILDISKTLMYEFHYGYIKPKYGENARLLFTDTDSLCYHIKTEDFYEDIKNYVETMFDTSNYPENHPSGLPRVNKKVIGMMKDECGGKQIAKFGGLRAKLYSYQMDYGDEEKKCKGVSRSTIKQDLVFDHYVECLQTKTKKEVSMNIIRSSKPLFRLMMVKEMFSQMECTRSLLGIRIWKNN